MKRIFAPLCAGLLLAATAVVAQAPAPTSPEPQLPPRYEVEVLVFANANFDPAEEHFAQALNGFADGNAALRDVPVFDDTNFGPLAPPVEPLPPPPIDPAAAARAEALSVRLLRPDELKLGTEYRKLRAIQAYRPLVHTGWVQPGLPEADAEPFDLKVLGVLNPSGTIRVHLTRFLHVTLDLTYQADGPGAVLATSDGLGELALAPRYRLTATRNVRSNELHYFDHPAFGVLVRITPVPAQNNQGRRPAA
jgi:hypothetical protein